jgi:hypothetical protein
LEFFDENLPLVKGVIDSLGQKGVELRYTATLRNKKRLKQK